MSQTLDKERLPGLLRLPTEIRQEIISYLFDAVPNISLSYSYALPDAIQGIVLSVKDHDALAHRQTSPEVADIRSLVHTCKSVHDDVLLTFDERHYAVIFVNICDDSERPNSLHAIHALRPMFREAIRNVTIPILMNSDITNLPFRVNAKILTYRFEHAIESIMEVVHLLPGCVRITIMPCEFGGYIDRYTRRMTKWREVLAARLGEEFVGLNREIEVSVQGVQWTGRTGAFPAMHKLNLQHKERWEGCDGGCCKHVRTHLATER